MEIFDKSQKSRSFAGFFVAKLSVLLFYVHLDYS